MRELGYRKSCPSFACQLRRAALRPHCEACSRVVGRQVLVKDLSHADAAEEVLDDRQAADLLAFKLETSWRDHGHLAGEEAPQGVDRHLPRA